jgi:hypothetical protein
MTEQQKDLLKAVLKGDRIKYITLLEQGIDVNFYFHDEHYTGEHSLLMYAIEKRKYDFVFLLLRNKEELKLDINYHNKDNVNALIWSVCQIDKYDEDAEILYDVIEKLLSLGADTLHQNFRGNNSYKVANNYKRQAQSSKAKVFYVKIIELLEKYPH